MTIEIKEKLTGSILDIGGGGEAVIGQIYKDRVTAIDNCKEELEEAPDCSYRKSNQLFHLLRGQSGRHGNNLYLIIGNVGHCIDGQCQH